MDTVLVGIFAPSAPMIVAQTEGFFRDRGLAVAYERVASSEAQFRDLASGHYALVHTAFDNVASYRLNPSNALGERLPVRACFALDFGMNLSAVAAPDVASVADLRGRVVSVDATDTGFAFVLYTILEAAGLKRGTDYEVVRHGGVLSRMEQLLAGNAAATLLSNGLELVATAAGLRRLAGAHDVVSPYLGSVIAATESWLEGNREVAARFRDGYEQALAFVVDPSNRDRVVREVAEARHLTIDVAQAVLSAELQDEGLARSTTIDADAAQSVLRLRARWGGFDAEQDLQALAAPGSELFARS
jgi:ABC-type nitrate/sulfonate/bicarbonate transport system substrate-binding protein